MGEAKEAFEQQPKGEITLLIEGKGRCSVEPPSLYELENELKDLISEGHSLSMVKLRFILFSFFYFVVFICLILFMHTTKSVRKYWTVMFFFFSLISLYLLY